MATVATRREKNLVQRKNNETHLTPTGLLMEGDFAQLALKPLPKSPLCAAIAISRVLCCPERFSRALFRQRFDELVAQFM